MGMNHCIGVDSGIDVLILVVRGLDISKGDEIICDSRYLYSISSWNS